MRADEPQADNVAEAWSAVPREAAALEFAVGDFALPAGGHLQGVQMTRDEAGRRRLAYMTHDSLTVGYLYVAEFGDDAPTDGRLIHVHKFPSDDRSPPLRHPGGFQIAGDVLAVGLEDNQQKTRSEVQFWNVAEPTAPVRLSHLTIRRQGEPKQSTAGAVGLLRQGKSVVAVGNWDCRAIDFYRSNEKPLEDPACRFEWLARWDAEAADKSDWRPDREFPSYQSLNLLAGDGGAIYLAGFATADHDVADLFAVDLDAEPARILRKLASKPVNLAAGCHFIHGAGTSMLEGRPAILATPRNLTRATTRLSLTR